MTTGQEFVDILRRCQFTHVVWIPDSLLGTWDAALSQAPHLTLIRPTREGEAIGIAAGLHLGGARPLVVMQCTGFFEAGDALRNVVHDLHLPLILVIGVRSLQSFRTGRTADTCPKFTVPIVQAWELPHVVLDGDFSAEHFELALQECIARGTAGAVLLAE